MAEAPKKSLAMYKGRNRNGELTDKQIALVEGVLKGTDLVAVATSAGYAASSEFYRDLGSQTVQKAIADRLQNSIASEGASIGYATMIELTNARNPASTRFQAAKWLLDAAGHGLTADNGPRGEKPVHEMTNAELEAFLARTEAVIAAGGSAPIITVKPDSGA